MGPAAGQHARRPRDRQQQQQQRRDAATGKKVAQAKFQYDDKE